MIIKIKKRDLVVLLIILLLIPIVYATSVTQTFFVLVTTTNRGPVITFVNSSNVTPVQGTTTTISIGFNASDEDGYSDLNDSSAMVNITYNGVHRNATCSADSYADNYTFYICTITFYYFDNATNAWKINASVRDNSDNATHNNTWNSTVSTLDAIVIENNLTFTGASLGSNDKASTQPLYINNTGNQDYGLINITAYGLRGKSDGTYYIGAGNFSVNSSSGTSGAGTQLINETAVVIGGSTLPHRLSGESDTRGNDSLYFWLDVPASGEITAQDYNSTTRWVVDVNSSSS